MTLILSRIQAFAGTAAVLALVLIVPARTETLPPHTINIEHWPKDVPCRVLKRDPDGTWEITVPYTLYEILQRGTKIKGLEVTEYWDRECRGQTSQSSRLLQQRRRTIPYTVITSG